MDPTRDGGSRGKIKKRREEGRGSWGVARSMKPGWVSYCLRSRADLPSGAD